MGGVENYWCADLCQDWQRPHVGNERVVAEGNAAFSHEHVGITSAGNLGRHVGHVPGGKELALFDIDSAAGFCGGNQEIGLAAEKRRNLQNINRFRDQRALAWLMHENNSTNMTKHRL